jgi:diguanylate cyclase (GGDEF)-like protein
MASSNRSPRCTVVDVSEDGMRYYAALPLFDRNRAPVGALVVISSRASLVRTLGAIKQMSFTLMTVCVLVGLAGVSYLRVRELAVRARRDELTGLHNHGHLQQFLGNQVRLAQRYDRPLTVMMLDIDHFKVFNDSHGHAAGDRILQHVASVMMHATRDTDMVARYGGEEFVVVMPETHPAQAVAGAQRTRTAVEKSRVRARDASQGHAEAVELGVTVSIGVASYPQDGRTAAELLCAADEALAAAKMTRNTVVAYEDVIPRSIDSTLQHARLDGFLRDSTVSSIRPLIAAIDMRDANTASHSEKTAEYATAIGRILDFTTQQLALTCKAALLHDVGMIAVPDHLLVKTTPLTPKEIEAIRNHVDLGTRTLMQSPLLAPVAEIVRSHHERFDGSGYPDGLVGDRIPLIARVIAVADALDALTSNRSYRPAMQFSAAAEVIGRESGKQFDPVVVEAAIEFIRSLSVREAA